jgi:gamma-glutamylcysteine synthetase
VASSSLKPSYTALAIGRLADAIFYHCYTLQEIYKNMANDFSRLTTAVQVVADNVAAVAEAIRNPAVDNNDQAVIDDLAGKLEAAANALGEAFLAEQAEDGVVSEPEAPAE